MRLYVGAAALVVVIVGAAWLVLALTFGHVHGGQDAYTRSAACVRREPSLTSEPAVAARYENAGLHALGIRWQRVRAVALFSDSLSPGSVDRADARIVSQLRRNGLSPAQIDRRLLHEDNLSLYYVTGEPSRAARAAIGSCVYLVHYNRIASALGLYINPHARRPFLPGARREH